MIDYSWCFVSDKGLREKNEDNYFEPIEVDQETIRRNGNLFAVIDGMGGHSEGKTAAYIAAQAFDEFYLKSFDPDEDDSWLQWAGQEVTSLSLRIDAYIYGARYLNTEMAGMGATLAGVLIRDQKAVVFHLGDSRIYHLSATKGFYQVTKDHSKVQALVDKGLITSEGARNHPDAHIVTRCLGIGPKRGDNLPDVQKIEICPGDQLLLCTDGLSSLVDESYMAQTLMVNGQNLKSSASKLVDKALMCGGYDNITVGIIQISSSIEPEESYEIGQAKGINTNRDFSEDELHQDTETFNTNKETE